MEQMYFRVNFCKLQRGLLLNVSLFPLESSELIVQVAQWSQELVKSASVYTYFLSEKAC